VIAWTSSPLTEAIQGLRGLLEDPAWQASAHPPVIRAALRQHLGDHDPVTRTLTAQALHLIEPDGERRLKLARQRLLAEPHPHVRAVLFVQLGRLIGQNAAAVDRLVAELADSGQWPLAASVPAAAPRAVDGRDAADSQDDATVKGDLLEVVASLLLLLAVRHEQPAAASLINRWFSHPLDHSEAFHQAAFQLRAMGMLATDREGDTVAAKAFALLREATDEIVTTVEAQLAGGQRDNDVWNSALRLTDTVADQLYAASEALRERQATASEQQRLEPSSRASTELFRLAMPLLEQLVRVHNPRITHRLVETLAHLAEHDPKRVLLAVHRAVAPGQGYQYEPMAVDLIVSLIRRYFADYRDLVTTDEEALTALRELIEVFVRAGWPSAITLAYQLPDAFR
jgi:hypothetical protein